MAQFLLAESGHGHAEAMTAEELVRRTGGSPRAMMAALSALRYERPIIFTIEDEGVFIVSPDEPHWRGRGFVELKVNALKFSDFRLDGNGHIVPPSESNEIIQEFSVAEIDECAPSHGAHDAEDEALRMLNSIDRKLD